MSDERALVYVAVERPAEGYDDVHSQLVAEDFVAGRWNEDWVWHDATDEVERLRAQLAEATQEIERVKAAILTTREVIHANAKVAQAEYDRVVAQLAEAQPQARAWFKVVAVLQQVGRPLVTKENGQRESGQDIAVRHIREMADALAEAQREIARLGAVLKERTEACLAVEARRCGNCASSAGTKGSTVYCDSPISECARGLWTVQHSCPHWRAKEGDRD